MSNFKSLVKLNQKIVKTLDDLLASGDWDTSLFLKVAGKQLHRLRDKAESLVEEGQSFEKNTKHSTQSEHYQKPPLQEGEVELFISLYQAQGANLQKWEEALRTLGSSSVGRPVYSEESHAEQAINARGNPLQEGYAVVYVKQNNIIKLPQARETSDRFGHVLMSLTGHAVQLENIHEFVHANKKRYSFREGKLSLIEK